MNFPQTIASLQGLILNGYRKTLSNQRLLDAVSALDRNSSSYSIADLHKAIETGAQNVPQILEGILQWVTEMVCISPTTKRCIHSSPNEDLATVSLETHNPGPERELELWTRPTSTQTFRRVCKFLAAPFCM